MNAIATRWSQRASRIEPVGPVTIGGLTVGMRMPRFGDHASWAAARAEAVGRITPAFATESGGARTVDSSRDVWVERCARLRRSARAGRAVPFVVVACDGDAETVIGEFGIDAVDEWTWVGEASVWLADRDDSGAVALWASAVLVLTAFTRPRPYQAVVGPVAVGNIGAGKLCAAVGMTVVARSRRLRVYDGAPADHDIWSIDNTPEARANLRALVQRSGH